MRQMYNKYKSKVIDLDSWSVKKLQVTLPLKASRRSSQWSFEGEPVIFFQTQAYTRQYVDAMIINDTSI
jgi:hypothetical protein